MQFDRLRWDRYGGLGAEVTVWVSHPIEAQIHSAWATLTTTAGRKTLAAARSHVSSRPSDLARVDTGVLRIVMGCRVRRGRPRDLLGASRSALVLRTILLISPCRRPCNGPPRLV